MLGVCVTDADGRRWWWWWRQKHSNWKKCHKSIKYAVEGKQETALVLRNSFVCTVIMCFTLHYFYCTMYIHLCTSNRKTDLDFSSVTGTDLLHMTWSGSSSLLAGSPVTLVESPVTFAESPMTLTEESPREESMSESLQLSIQNNTKKD